jgi:hypothetical protein
MRSWRLPKSRGNGPWAIASFIAIPLFFTSLMASTLALEKPRLVQWNGPHHLITMWHEPSSATEARIWLFALVPPLLLSFIGWICSRVPFGWYLACAAGIVEALAVVHRLDRWTLHHTQRFKIGVDLIPASNLQSNQYNRGEWEKLARETALSLSHWTIGVALAGIVALGALYIRRRYFSRQPFMAGTLPDDGILEGVHAPDATGASVPIE